MKVIYLTWLNHDVFTNMCILLLHFKAIFDEATSDSSNYTALAAQPANGETQGYGNEEPQVDASQLISDQLPSVKTLESYCIMRKLLFLTTEVQKKCLKICT